MESFIDTLANKPQDLLLPNEGFQKVALNQVKTSFDPIAKSYSIFDQVHVDGLDAEQVWAQAQMVVDGVVKRLLGEDIPSLAGSKRSADEMESDDEDDEELDFDDRVQYEDEDDDDEDISANGRLDVDSDSEVEEDEGEMQVDDYEESDSEQEGEEAEQGDSNADNFYNKDDFTQQILAMEDDNFGAEDDEDEDVDMFGDVEDEEDSDAENAKYSEFFDPVSKKSKSKTKGKSKRAVPETKEDDEEDFEGLDLEATDGNVEDAMESARRDLFAESEDEDDGEGANGENLSTFEKQQQEIMKQIQDLEEENVAEKHWAVKGEIKKADRPKDSLIYENLDFERSSKPVPVITQEVTESLEDMIRRRIKNEQFDDIPRRLPGSVAQFKRRDDVEVQETKSQKSLAELYEDDYRKQNDSSYVDEKETEMDEQHKEIVDLFNSVSHKLDALCSWNFTPKQPKPTLSIRSNAASISMEDAQPSAATSASMLAPQEVYKPTASDSKREVIGRDNMPVAKAEMSREERKRQRKRNKAKRSKQAEQQHDKLRSQAASKKGGRADVIQTLKQGNVTVIGKQGEKRDIQGNLRKDKRPATSSGFKL